MSLMDEFLLDPYPLDVWIAARTDGVIGSGTEDDPYNGSTASPATVQITSITPGIPVDSITFNSGTGKATATTHINHGFSNGDSVQVEGATPPNAPDGKCYNGVFTISNVSATQFSYIPTQCTPTNPASGTLSCRLAGTNPVYVTTSSAHGFSTNDLIFVDGATGTDATYYNGSFVISVPDTTHFTYLAWGWPSGNATGTITCKHDPYQFDTVMRAMPTSVARIQASSTAPVTAIVLAYGHNFANGDFVLISGVTGSNSQYYNGVFQIIISPSYSNFDAFLYTPKAGAPLGPYSFTGAIWARLYKPDISIPASTPLPLAVRFGPGTFETRGFTPQATPPLSRGWSPQSGMKIFGSGMDVTVLRLVRAMIDDNASDYLAIGSVSDKFVDTFEASDFTVDCNLAGQPSQVVACGAVGVQGTQTRLRRVRAVNFGTQTPITAPFNTECFTLVVGGAAPQGVEPVNCWIIDCIAEQPSLNNAIETTVIGVGGSENGELMIYHRGCGIRNCLVDCEYRDKPVPISQFTPPPALNGIATVITSMPHGRNNNDWVRISGIVVNGSTNNPYNGSYQVTWLSATSFTYEPSPTLTSTPDPSEMWVGRYSSQLIQIKTVSAPTGSGPYNITVQTVTPHFRVPAGNVAVNGLQFYSGSFAVYQVLDAYTFLYQVDSNKGQPSLTGSEFIGVSFQGAGADNGTAAVVEGNRIFNCLVGTYHDTYNTKDQVVRNNYYRAVAQAIFQNLGQPGVSTTTLLVPLAVTNGGSGLIATATTSVGHGLNTGDKVIISGATPNDYNSPAGGWVVTFLSTTQFKYTMNTPPSVPAQNAGYAVPDGQRLLASLTYALQSGLYVATGSVDLSLFPAGHGLSLNETVYVSRASLPTYNGYFKVAALLPPPNDKTGFQFVLPDNPGSASTSGYYGRLWQTGRMVAENNVMEILPAQTNWQSPLAILMGFASAPITPPLVPQAQARRNVIRHPDSGSDPSLNPPVTAQSAAIQISGCLSQILEENVISVERVNPIQEYYCGSTQFFANQTPGGALVQGAEGTIPATAVKVQELSTLIDDASVLSI
jgi:hypothetical protein